MLRFSHEPANGPACRRARLAQRPAVERFETRALLATFSVTNVGDSGPGSLREAILSANAQAGTDTIAFSIGSGRQTIIPASPLPQITDTAVVDASTQPGYAGTPLIELNGANILFLSGDNVGERIPGVHGLVVTAGGSTIRGLAINRFTGSGIVLQGSGLSLVAGNNIGTDVTGNLPLGNGQDGVLVLDSRTNTIGGPGVGEGNLISGNGGNGIQITTSTGRGLTGNNVVAGNRIGTDRTGSFDIGNGASGVIVATTGNTIGGEAAAASNIIAFNGGYGVQSGSFYLPFGQQVRNAILSNSIYSNSFQGINLGYGAESPVYGARLTSAFPTPGGGGTTVQGQFVGLPSTNYLLQVFSNQFSDPSGAGEGQSLVGTINISTDAFGVGRINSQLLAIVAPGQSLSATATDPNRNTSSFFSNTRVAPLALADLVLRAGADPAPVLSGNELTYTVTASNYGPSIATGVSIAGWLPANAQFISSDASQGAISRDGTELLLDIGTLYPGDFVTLTVVVAPTTGVLASADFDILADQDDPDPSDNAESLDVGIIPDVTPPQIENVRLDVGLSSINGIVLTSNERLDPAQAQNPINYSLRLVRGFGTAQRKHGSTVALNPPVYDDASQTITLTPTRPLRLGQLYLLTVNGVDSAGVTDLAGNLLDGNSDGVIGGSYEVQISRGAPNPNAARNRRPQPPRRQPATRQVRLVETLVGRRVLTGPAGSVNPSSSTSFNSSVKS